MKPALLVFTGAMFSTYLAPPLPNGETAPRGAAERPRAVEPARPEASDLRRLVWSAKAEAGRALGEASFDFKPGTDRPRVAVDPDALREGLAALMSASAASAGARRPRLRVRLKRARGTITMVMTDAGPGLDVPDIAAMFGDGDASLARARRRIERAGGVVNVASEMGAGTTYLIDLPPAS